MLIFLLAAVVAGVVLLVTLGLYNSHAVERQWDFALTASGSRARDDLEARLAAEAQLREMTLCHAGGAGGEKRLALLGCGLRMIESQGKDLVTMLRGLGVLSRMAAAIAPVRPLRPAAFRLGQLRGLAALAAASHHLTVTMGERLRLRAYVLRHGCRIVIRTARRAVRRVRAEQLELASEDLTAIGRETLETFHTLLLSMEAEPRPTFLFVVDE